MIFLSSIYGLVTESQTPDAIHAEQLAKVLNLTGGRRAMEFPVAIKSVIWYGTNEDKLFVEKRHLTLKDLGRADLTKKESDALVQYIVDRTPFLLQYAKTSQMAYDVQRLCSYLQQTPSHAAA